MRVSRRFFDPNQKNFRSLITFLDLVKWTNKPSHATVSLNPVYRLKRHHEIIKTHQEITFPHLPLQLLPFPQIDIGKFHLNTAEVPLYRIPTQRIYNRKNEKKSSLYTLRAQSYLKSGLWEGTGQAFHPLVITVEATTKKLSFLYLCILCSFEPHWQKQPMHQDVCQVEHTEKQR